MKRILLIAILSCLYINGSAQDVRRIYGLTRIGLYGGGGLATSNNYDVGISGGLDFETSVLNQTILGATVFLQGYSLFYDNEANSAKHGQGIEGLTLRHSSKYVFFCPQLKYHLFHKLNFISWVNVNAGVGMKMSGFDSLHKWNHRFDSTSVGHYDSSIDASKNLTSMVARVGVGLVQDIYLGRGNWWFSFKEDFGFLLTGLTKTGDINTNNPARTQYSPEKLNPGYVSLQIGITYIKPTNKKH